MNGKKALSCLGLLFFACGGSDPAGPVEDITAEGWALFVEGRFQDAADKFTEAIGADDGWADAYNGRGWSRIELRDLAGAESDLSAATDLGDGQVRNEARTGLGSVLNSLGEYAEAVSTLRAVTGSDASFQFSHRASIDIIDVRLSLSSGLVGLAETEDDPGIVDGYFDEIADNINLIDPGEPILRSDPETWALGSDRFSTFEEALLEKLEWLITVYFG